MLLNALDSKNHNIWDIILSRGNFSLTNLYSTISSPDIDRVMIGSVLQPVQSQGQEGREDRASIEGT